MSADISHESRRRDFIALHEATAARQERANLQNGVHLTMNQAENPEKGRKVLKARKAR